MFTIRDDGPSIEATEPTGQEVTIENLGSSAGVGYNNSFGYYVKGEDGQPTTGRVIWSNVKSDVGDTQVIEGYAPDEIGYFVIPDGSRLNSELGNDTEVTFEQVDGAWVATIVGEDEPLAGKDANAPVLFSDPALQPDGASHVENNAEEGHLNWEDIYGSGSDRDYNDVNVNVNWAPANLTVNEADLDGDAQYDFSGYFDTDYGSDGAGSAQYSMSIAEEGADTGLVDTESGETVKVKMEADGSITGYFEDGSNEVPVFTMSVNENGVVTLDQVRAVSHPLSGAVGASDPVNLSADTVFLNQEVFDSDGDSTTASIDVGGVVYFLDDGPTANDDTASVDEGNVVGGNVLTDGTADDFGADGAATGGGVVGVAVGSDTSTPVTGNVGATLQGSYGTLTLGANGAYTYTATANAITADATDVFTYTIEDADGDTSTTTLSIDVADVTLVGDDTTAEVNEAALDDVGSDPTSAEETATGSVSVAGTDVSYALTGDGTGNNGTLTLDSDGNFTYTLETPVTDTTGDDGENTVNGVESFEYVATDANGNTTTGTITVDVTDDVPTAYADTVDVTEGADVEGNVLTDGTAAEFGADGAATGGGVVGVAVGSDTSTPVTGNVGATLQGSYGTLTLGANGAYTYTATANAITADATDVFTYTIEDADGDTSTTTLSIDVADVTLVGDDTTAEVNEAALDDVGSDPTSAEETATGSVSVAGTDVSYALTGDGTGNNGTLTLDSDGNFTYTLETPVTDTTGDDGENTVNGVESFEYVATDANGNTTTGTITVDVTDDVPTAVDDTVESVEGTSSTQGSDLVLMIDTSGSVSDSDLTSMKSSLQNLFNSGSVHSVFVTSFASDGQFHDSGVDGGWYTDLGAAMTAINSLSSGGQTDYDSALETVTENFTPPPAGGDKLVSMFISDGEPNQHNGTPSVGIDFNEEANWIQFLEANGFDDSYAVGYGGLSYSDVSKLEPIAWTEGESWFTYNEYYDSTADDNVIILNDVDDLASTLSSTVTATPTPVTGNVLDNDTAGADGYAAPALVDVTYDGDTVTFTETITSATFDTNAGTVVINSDGSYEFTGLADTDNDVSALIGYTIEDGDGDTSSAYLMVQTRDSQPTAYDNVNNAVITEETVPGETTPYYFFDIHAQVNDSGEGGTTTETRFFNINAGHTGEIEFDIEVDSGEFKNHDSYTWTIFKDGVVDSSQTYNDDSDHNNVTVSGLDEGSYQLQLTLNDSGQGSRWDDLHVDLENITLRVTSPAATIAVAAAAQGNVITDANALVSSSDPWAATDDTGTDGANVSAVNGVSLSSLADSTNSSYAAADGYKEYDSTYGTFFINTDGDYAYEPDADLDNIGQQEIFSYTLTQPDGDSDTANLVINLADSEFVAQTPTTTGTSADDLMLGTTGDDLLDGAAGDDHIESGDGDDILIGGAGDDILYGGAGADTFAWNFGDEITGDDQPANDQVMDFTEGKFGTDDNADKLDLSDLLQGEDSDNINEYIFAEEDGDNVVLSISSEGNLNGSTSAADQKITLEGKSFSDFGVNSGASEDLIAKLIEDGQLKIDQ
ncbi:DUF5801 repeats-in-toxin domain-containing protein [Vreelandella janggokensis]|uniref:DUF5801 repeats-in-toxin domain-containing protein n=1 Tax=Vreelandella janggokensis TaxID=370767 RepID=UPI00285864F1|nr:DUF5801 repeats-in-toxin domain-containing protein [Halomonas janggokensis]MDR5886678.1 DUF5801 repeats-in-toxin domain-containing protein [Halomonas janggokensis]